MQATTPSDPIISLLMARLFTAVTNICFVVFIALISLSAPPAYADKNAANPALTLRLLEKFCVSLSGTMEGSLSHLYPDNSVRVEASVQVVDRIFGHQHAFISYTTGPHSIKYILLVDQKALTEPLLLIKDLLMLQTATNKISITSDARSLSVIRGPLTMAELISDAQAGSLMAQLQLKKLNQFNLQGPKFTESFLQALVKLLKLDSLEKAQNLLTNYVSKEIKNSNVEIAYLQKKLQTDYDKNLTAWKQMTSQLLSEASIQNNLASLVAKNDRAGVRKLLEQMLPWSFMQPFERENWKSWLEAIEHPNLKRTEVVFRGVNEENDKPKYPAHKMQRASNLFSIKKFLANMTINITALNPGLDLNTKNKLSNVTAQLDAHSGNSEKSNFISFTTDTETAMHFSGTGVIVARIDRRRLIPNLSNGSESEILVPLIVFPDEIIHYLTGPGTVIQLEKIASELKNNKLTHTFYQAEGSYGFATEGLRYFQGFTQKMTPNKCKDLFN